MSQKRTILIVILLIVFAAVVFFLSVADLDFLSTPLITIVTFTLSIALLLATYNYVEAARPQAQATNRQASAATDPVVFFGVEGVLYSEQFFIQNIGPGIAYDVNFQVIRDFNAAALVDDKKLSDIAFLNNTFKALGSGQKIPFAIIDPQKHSILPTKL